MKTTAQLQYEILVLWANLAAVIGSLGGLVGGDIDTEAEVAGRIAQLQATNRTEYADQIDELLALLNELLSRFASEDGA